MAIYNLDDDMETRKVTLNGMERCVGQIDDPKAMQETIEKIDDENMHRTWRLISCQLLENTNDGRSMDHFIGASDKERADFMFLVAEMIKKGE